LEGIVYVTVSKPIQVYSLSYQNQQHYYALSILRMDIRFSTKISPNEH